MTRLKPILSDRKKKADEQFRFSSKPQKDIVDVLKRALQDGNIKGEIICINPKDVDFERMSDDYKTNSPSHVIFLQFVVGGHIAVVGAGKDIAFPSRASSVGTWGIISEIENIQWKTDEIIVIPISELNGIGIKNVDNVLKCRNGVEHYLGKYLSDHDIPILNYYQHVNYSGKFWDKCIENNYKLK